MEGHRKAKTTQGATKHIITGLTSRFSWHGTLTVHDYAYQPIPEQPILAGVHP